MATMNISLPDPMRDWVKGQIDTGLYANSSDYVRDLIRKDQLRMQNVKALQQAINEGLESGAAQPFDSNASST
ncbi:MAG: type II toxin-antitoxin system ParD family antitoxin [Hydrogenovibrio sp.]